MYVVHVGFVDSPNPAVDMGGNKRNVCCPVIRARCTREQEMQDCRGKELAGLPVLANQLCHTGAHHRAVHGTQRCSHHAHPGRPHSHVLHGKEQITCLLRQAPSVFRYLTWQNRDTLWSLANDR